MSKAAAIGTRDAASSITPECFKKWKSLKPANYLSLIGAMTKDITVMLKYEEWHAAQGIQCGPERYGKDAFMEQWQWQNWIAEQVAESARSMTIESMIIGMDTMGGRVAKSIESALEACFSTFLDDGFLDDGFAQFLATNGQNANGQNDLANWVWSPEADGYGCLARRPTSVMTVQPYITPECFNTWIDASYRAYLLGPSRLSSDPIVTFPATRGGFKYMSSMKEYEGPGVKEYEGPGDAWNLEYAKVAPNRDQKIKDELFQVPQMTLYAPPAQMTAIDMTEYYMWTHSNSAPRECRATTWDVFGPNNVEGSVGGKVANAWEVVTVAQAGIAAMEEGGPDSYSAGKNEDYTMPKMFFDKPKIEEGEEEGEF
jgi:hypothetical protein